MSIDQCIICPYCGKKHTDEDGYCVSYWGGNGPEIVECLNEYCEKEFEVHETVVRTYETKKIEEKTNAT